MGKWRDLTPGFPIPATWPDGMEELLSRYFPVGARLYRHTATQVRFDHPNNEQLSVAIADKPRWNAAATVLTATHPGGAAATYGVYLTANQDAFGTDINGHETQTNSMAFGLKIGAPSGAGAEAISRRIGSVVWDGATITKVTMHEAVQVTGPMLADGIVAGTARVTWTRQPDGSFVVDIPADSITATEIAPLTVTAAELANALKSPAAGTEGLRRLGTAAGEALPGDHASVTNQRVPVDASVTPVKIAGVLLSPAANVEGLRRLGTGATEALPGNHASTTDQRVPTDGSVTAAKVAAALKPSSGALNATEALRALGTAAGLALPGDHVSVTNQRVPTDSSVVLAKIDPSLRSPADNVEGIRKLGTAAGEAMPGTDSTKLPPIGSIIPYGGTGDPAGGKWVLADGRLLTGRATTYAALAAAIGDAYNGGVNPGADQIRIPDKRGRTSVGQSNMGTAQGNASGNARAPVSRGGAGGEVDHLLTANESGVKTHGHAKSGGVNNGNADHDHYVSVWHANDVGDGSWAEGASAQWHMGNTGYQAPVYQGPTNGRTQGASGGANHGHGDSIAVTNHGGENAGASHNNLMPYEADNWIVRVA